MTRGWILCSVALVLMLASLACAAPSVRTYSAPSEGRLYVLAEADSSVRIELPGASSCEVQRRPLHGTLKGSGSPLLYTPEKSYRGADSFACRVAGGGLLEVGVTVDRISVAAVDETEPIDAGGDTADDVAIWIHPEQSASSVIIGTSKAKGNAGGMLLYALSGDELERGRGKRINNVDLRYGFPLDRELVDLVAASNRSDDTVTVFAVWPDGEMYNVSRQEEGVPVDFGDSRSNESGIYGFCLYRSPSSGKFYGFATSKTGFVAQIELFESEREPGTVDGEIVRTFDVNPGVGVGAGDRHYIEACVADDFHEALYIAEEDHGIWRYGAEPDDGVERRLVDTTGAPGQLMRLGDVEGLAIYQATRSTGYLIASNQGDNSFVVYDRCGSNGFVTKFEIVTGPDADGVTDTDGIEVVSHSLGSGVYASGIFIAQDNDNTSPGNSGNQNFKLVPWESIATAIEPNLTTRTDFDPRTAPW